MRCISPMKPITLIKSGAGFTLLEILIATGIFMTVMVIAIAIFTTTTSSSGATEQLRVTSQSARFAFEAITREIRLARGLVVIDKDTDDQIMLIPPFKVNNDEPIKPIIYVYQVTKTLNQRNQPAYSLTRRVYSRTDTELTVTLQKNEDGALTVKEITDEVTPQGDLESLNWSSVNPRVTEQVVSLLTQDLRVDVFKIIRYSAYPDPGKTFNNLKVQPFIQLDLSAQNTRFNPTRRDGSNVRTTLRTMIVPRDFVGKYEVVQPGVQSGQ